MNLLSSSNFGFKDYLFMGVKFFGVICLCWIDFFKRFTVSFLSILCIIFILYLFWRDFHSISCYVASDFSF